MALIDNVTIRQSALRSSVPAYLGAGIDWDLVAATGLKAVKEALRREIWEWIDAHPDEVIFRVNVDTKVWILPIKIRWAVKARDAEPFVEFILGSRP